MRLTHEEALARLVAHDHGVLGTMHPERGPDLVPVVFGVSPDGRVGIPVDRVKPKATTTLQRERNLQLDPRATLLVDHWDRDDWSRLWWVRAELRWLGDLADGTDVLAGCLAERYVQYGSRPFHRVLAFELLTVTGWSGG